MAILDTDRNVVTIRLVFDGLPRSGKTTTVRALAGGLSRPVVSPGELDGRTLLFDWMDYTGGRFEGYQICCQVVSVPGQPALLHRRRLLLESADAVVFVIDSTRASLPAATREAADVRELLASRRGEASIGMIVQANKRDLDEAVPIDDVRRTLHQHLPDVAVVEASAATGDGIRETFVFGVRVALDRVRELIRTNRLSKGSPDVGSASDLLLELERSAPRQDSPDGDAGAGSEPRPPGIPGGVQGALEDVLVSQGAWVAGPSAPSTPGWAPLLPDDGVPSGLVWPPIEGRLYLHEATARGAEVVPTPAGWTALLPTGWTAHSPGSACFETLEEGRDALIRWARAHSALGSRVSQRRCVVLSHTGIGGFRAWQLVKREPTLRDHVRAALRLESTAAVADALLEASRLLAAAPETLAGSSATLAPGMDTIGDDRGRPVYVGLVPYPVGPPRTAEPLPGPFQILERELGPMVCVELKQRPGSTAPVIDRILRRLEGRFEPKDVGTALVLLLLGETPSS